MSTSPWDSYAEFYDWENARTFGRRDVAFWRGVVRRERGPVLELGCGTGRVLFPIARTGVTITGIDLSAQMLARARTRARRVDSARHPQLVRGDVTALPFPSSHFGVVLAPYGFLQSLLDDRALARALREAARVLRPGGLLGIDLVPELATWPAYRRQLRLRGKAHRGATVSLVETVRQDRRRGVTMFDETFIARRNGRTSRRSFTLTFRTLPMPAVRRRIERAGFVIEAVLGDYHGAPWDTRAEAWIVLARVNSL